MVFVKTTIMDLYATMITEIVVYLPNGQKKLAIVAMKLVCVRFLMRISLHGFYHLCRKLVLPMKIAAKFSLICHNNGFPQRWTWLISSKTLLNNKNEKKQKKNCDFLRFSILYLFMTTRKLIQ